MIHVGELRHKAIFKVPHRVTDFGDTTVQRRTGDFEAWVDIQPLGGSAGTAGDQVQAVRLHLVRMRYDDRVHQEQQLVVRGRTFEIVNVLNIDERDIELQLHCRELA